MQQIDYEKLMQRMIRHLSVMRMGQDGEATMLVANQLQNFNIESHEHKGDEVVGVVVDAIDLVVVSGEYVGGGLFVSGVEVQLEDEHQNMDSHNNENEVEGGGKAFVVVNMEDNEERRGISLLVTM